MPKQSTNPLPESSERSSKRNQAAVENPLSINAGQPTNTKSQASAPRSLVDQENVDHVLDQWLAGAVAPAGTPTGTVVPGLAVAAPRTHPLTAPLLQPLIRLPFDITAIRLDYAGFKLADSEANDLTAAWLSVLQRLLPAAQSVDIVIAALCTAGIVGVKTIEYNRDMKILEKAKPKAEKAETV